MKKLLIANRGEIACRIIRACRELGIRAVAVYSDADARALHVRLADEALPIGPAPAHESYLNGDRIIAAARQAACDAIHPGYGFLAENANFAEAVTNAGLVFIGPPASAMRAMGSKTAGRENAIKAGIPVAPALELDLSANPQSLIPNPLSTSLPVLIKAVAGGGGKGMRLVRNAEEWHDALESAQREAHQAFGDGRVFVEKYIEDARHIEIQILADAHGNCVHLFERECSIQRRHQKLIEESPSPFVDAELRARMGEAAVRLARAVGYVNAGTLEFLVDAQRNFYFLEMNTRLQVEHAVTEMVTGLDIVAWQIRIAQGEQLPFEQANLQQRGHAIECRICAEDPAQQFLPSAGRLTRVIEPRAVRVEAGFATGDDISVYYDSLISKVIVHDERREAAIAKMAEALRSYVIEGVTTNIDFLRDVLAHPAFRQGETTTHFIEKYFAGWDGDGLRSTDSGNESERKSEQMAVAQSGDPWQRLKGFRIGERRTLNFVQRPGDSAATRSKPLSSVVGGPSSVLAPMPGIIRKVLVKVGDEVKPGTTLVVMEAMKMEMRLAAPHKGRVSQLHCAEGQVVEREQVLVEMDSHSG